MKLKRPSVSRVAAGEEGSSKKTSDEQTTNQIEQAGIAVLSAALGAVAQARFSRKIKVKVGDVEVEAASLAEVRRLLDEVIKIEESHRGGSV